MSRFKTRSAAATLLIGAGVVVAILGWLGVSRETEVAFQLPYIASAGVAALMLMAAGAAVWIGAQVERDASRLDEIENAVRSLAREVGRIADQLTEVRGSSPLRAVAGGQPRESSPRARRPR